ncbi:MAG: phosphoribosylaminoimidazolesuccinocarboxamide synthase [Patescibacteria group bacterium]
MSNLAKGAVMELKKGDLLAEGKTKKIWSVIGDDGAVIVEQKDDITAFDDPSFTKKFGSKGRCANLTTCRVFEMLKAAGIPVAYLEQISPTEFMAEKSDMIPLEVVGRRYAYGSYLKRHPQLAVNEGLPPVRFHRLVVEFFLKTSDGKLVDKFGETVVEGLDPKKGEEDPLIEEPNSETWDLYHPKKPNWVSEAYLCKSIDNQMSGYGGMKGIKTMEDTIRKVFLVLEAAWAQLGCRFIDFKIEFGINLKGEIVVADVIDNDSWRLRDADWNELSKEAFRQGENLAVVEEKYGLVASLVERFRVPRQALVLWRGSSSDSLPISPELQAELSRLGLSILDEVLSGHKKTRRCLDRLEEILTQYPDGGAILPDVGRSNGLGPILASHTSWPVVTIPATLKEFPPDIWSSVRMASDVPMATVWPDSNAILFAVNILAAKNPLLYMWRQIKIEELDK